MPSLSRLILILAAGLLLSPLGGRAQERPTPAVQDPAQLGPVTPAGAFMRSFLLPGWGHVAVGSPTRGAFYLTAQSATGWMIWRSEMGRRSARQSRMLELRSVQDDLRRSGVSSPDSLRFLAERSPRVRPWDELTETRAEQVEDWAALGIFLVFLGATDALVSAHLANFPEPLELDIGPQGGGAWHLGFRLPIGGLRRSGPR
jgi:hypothetical protein